MGVVRWHCGSSANRVVRTCLGTSCVLSSNDVHLDLEPAHEWCVGVFMYVEENKNGRVEWGCYRAFVQARSVLSRVCSEIAAIMRQPYPDDSTI